MSDYKELRQAADEDGGLHVTTMEVLREIEGAGRLGKLVRDSISRNLEAHGLGHLPAELPAYQELPVRLYVKNSAIAQVVSAVLHPSAHGDQVLREAGTSESDEIVRKIRELVCP